MTASSCFVIIVETLIKLIFFSLTLNTTFNGSGLYQFADRCCSLYKERYYCCQTLK